MHPSFLTALRSSPARSWSYTIADGIEVLFFPGARRAGAARGATVVWLDAASSEEARAHFAERAA